MHKLYMACTRVAPQRGDDLGHSTRAYCAHQQNRKTAYVIIAFLAKERTEQKVEQQLFDMTDLQKP